MTATRTETAFRLTYTVARHIDATPERVWDLLTDAAGIARWNPAVSRIGGTIAPGEKLAIEVPLAPGRTFTPRVTAFEPAASMTWSDGMAPMFKGVRTFTLTPAEGGVRFEMTEEFTGLFLPLIKGSLPDFREAFDTWADSLARAACA